MGSRTPTKEASFLRESFNDPTPIPLWLLPLALLVCRSRFLPRFLGVWLVINGFAYVTISLTGLLLPQYQGRVFTISLPALLGELALMFWLVIKGARPQPLSTAGSSLAAVSV
jgi:Domain of unknown function (DUF4386)